MSASEGLIAGRKRALADLCRAFRLDLLFAFGSRAGEVRQWLDGELEALRPGPADVDVGVRPEQGIELSVHEKVRVATAMEDILGAGRVDLLSLPEADPFVAANVIRGELLYARDEHEADEYVLFILRRAGDLAPLERERISLILGRRQ